MSVLIIAEAGVNHNGSIELAKKLVDEAKNAGADIVKFQTFIASNLVSKNTEKAQYQKKNTNDDTGSQYDMLKKLELSFSDFMELNNYCKKKGIIFLSTAFDFDSIDFLNTLDMKMWKIPSGEITNLPYLIKIAKLNKDIILSTGMCEMNDIENAVEVLKKYSNANITILHCTTEYPTPFQDVNLKAMITIKEKFNLEVGYSDHTNGIEVAISAVALGASVIEKHFTLDKTMDGPDHKASLEPNELKAMIDSIRNIELALGDGVKSLAESEKKNIAIARKSIVAKKCIKKGEMLTKDNMTVKRPGNGISPMRWFDILGKFAIRDFEKDELIEI